MRAHATLLLIAPLLLLLCARCGEPAPAPFGLGLFSLSDAANALSNGTSFLESLALAHINHKLEKLELLQELLDAGLNFTQTLG